MSRKSMTAAELMAELANDSEYQQKLREKASQREQLERELASDEAALVSELRERGIIVHSVWDLVNTNTSYRTAIPILAKHLDTRHHPRTVQGLVRALTTPESQGIAFDQLVKAFVREVDADSELKWLLGAAIAEASTSDDVDKVIELANNPIHGQGRSFLPLGLVRASKEKVYPFLEAWTSDRTLAENAIKAIQLFR